MRVARGWRSAPAGQSSAPPAYYARVPLPPFLLIEDRDEDVATFVAMVKRIGLVNSVRAIASIDEAKRYLLSCPASALPVVVLSGDDSNGEDDTILSVWLGEQDPPLSTIPALTLEKPLEMYAVIRRLKALALPERARIDTTTLTVRVELWPHGTQGLFES